MSNEYKVITSPVVSLFVTSNLNCFTSERRFQKDVAIAELKGKLELLTGASVANMTLQLLSKDDQLLTELKDNDALLGSYPVDDGMRIHVIDRSQRVGEFEDVSQVQKFTLSDEEYAKKGDSMRSFLMKNKFGKYAESNAETQNDEEDEELAAKAMKVNDRCEVRVQGQAVRRGTVAFIGTVHFKPGLWIGIKYDEPLGKNDGSVGGQRYFDCPAKYGGFVKPQNVTVGDFPEETFEDDF